MSRFSLGFTASRLSDALQQLTETKQDAHGDMDALRARAADASRAERRMVNTVLAHLPELSGEVYWRERIARAEAYLATHIRASCNGWASCREGKVRP